MATKTCNFRFPKETIDKIDYLCNLAGGISRTALISGFVTAEYDRVQGNPELRAVIEQMTALQAQMEGLMKDK